jgi:hypothetical protein
MEFGKMHSRSMLDFDGLELPILFDEKEFWMREVQQRKWTC